MTDRNRDPESPESKRERKAEFMRAYVIASVRVGRAYGPDGESLASGPSWNRYAAMDAGDAWNVIEAEAAK